MLIWETLALPRVLVSVDPQTEPFKTPLIALSTNKQFSLSVALSPQNYTQTHTIDQEHHWISMQRDKPNDEDKPAAPSFPLMPENNRSGLSSGWDGWDDYNEDNAIEDLRSFLGSPVPLRPISMELGEASFPFNTEEIPVSNSVTMPDFMKLNIQQDPQYMTSSTARNRNPGENAFPQQMVRRTLEQTTTNSSANSYTNEGISAFMFQNPRANRNSLPMRSSAEVGYQLNRQGGSVYSPIVAGPQSNNHFVSGQSSRPVFHHPQSNEQVKAETNAKVNTNQSGSLRKMDGSFLSLGPKSNIDPRISSWFSTNDISSKQESAACPNFITSQVRHATRNLSSQGQNTGVPSNQGQNAGVGLTYTQESVSGSTVPAPYMGSLGIRNEADGINIGSNGLNSRPFHVLQTPEVNMQQNMVFTPINRISSSVGDMDVRYGNLQGNQFPTSWAYSNLNVSPISGDNRLPALATQSDNYTGGVTGTDPYQLHSMGSNQNLSLGSFLSSRLRAGETAVRHGHSGLSSSPKNNLDQAAVSNLLLNGNHFQANSNSTVVPTASGVFPMRLGIQSNTTRSPEGSSIPINGDVQPASQSPGMPVLPCANYCGPFTPNGPPQRNVAIQNWRPVSTSGRGLPLAKINEAPRDCEFFTQPSLKRGAVQAPPDATWVHRRKLTHTPTAPTMQYRPIPPPIQKPVPLSMQNTPVPPSLQYKPVPPSMQYKPPVPPSMQYKPVPSSMQYKSAAPSIQYKPVPPSVSNTPKIGPARLPTVTAAHPSKPVLDHIKWQGADEQSEPTGDKCLLCKRDLIFSPEGLVERPPIPPPVAVLPCGHTFHDLCLQKITPEDESKCPPCIPCAMGEH